VKLPAEVVGGAKVTQLDQAERKLARSEQVIKPTLSHNFVLLKLLAKMPRNRTGGLPMIGRRTCAIAIVAAFGMLCSAPSAIANPFDGNWSIFARTTVWPLRKPSFPPRHTRRANLRARRSLRRLCGEVQRQRLLLRTCPRVCSGRPAHRPWRGPTRSVLGLWHVGRSWAVRALLWRLGCPSVLLTHVPESRKPLFRQ